MLPEMAWAKMATSPGGADLTHEGGVAKSGFKRGQLATPLDHLLHPGRMGNSWPSSAKAAHGVSFASREPMVDETAALRQMPPATADEAEATPDTDNDPDRASTRPPRCSNGAV